MDYFSCRGQKVKSSSHLSCPCPYPHPPSVCLCREILWHEEEPVQRRSGHLQEVSLQDDKAVRVPQSGRGIFTRSHSWHSHIRIRFSRVFFVNFYPQIFFFFLEEHCPFKWPFYPFSNNFSSQSCPLTQMYTVCTLYIKTPCCHNSAHTATVQRVPDLPSLPHIYFADTLHTYIHTYMHTPKITRRWRMWLGAPLGPSPLAPHTPPSNPFFSRSLPSRPDKDGYSCGSPSPSAHRSSLFFFSPLLLSSSPSLPPFVPAGQNQVL